MTRKSIIGLAVGVIAVALIATATAYACGEKGCPLHQATSKDVKVETKNVANGVVLTMTTDKPDEVKTLQAHFANCGKDGHACGFAPGSEECKKAHESGKCPGHDAEHACPHGAEKK